MNPVSIRKKESSHLNLELFQLRAFENRFVIYVNSYFDSLLIMNRKYFNFFFLFMNDCVLFIYFSHIYDMNKIYKKLENGHFCIDWQRNLIKNKQNKKCQWMNHGMIV